jgi:SAM-dependent methyltransferase
MAGPAGRVKAALSALQNKAYYASPRSYWDSRHDRFRASLRGVGAIGLDERGNEADYEVKWQHLQPVLEAARREGADTLFDAGCGIGFFTGRAHTLGYGVEALDFSRSAIEVARVALPDSIVYHVASVSDFRSDRCFDVVMCIDVLFHIVSDMLWADALASLARLTKPGGWLVIQDHLVAPADKLPEDPRGKSHTRWRARVDYTALLDGWRLDTFDSYVVPNERGTKDLMTFRRPAISSESGGILQT